jgi:hypothetical protein
MTHQTAMSPAMQQCIEDCQRCHNICLQMAMDDCLRLGGKHVAPDHFRLMRDCAEICETTANFMLGSSSKHAEVCGVCADICEACAQSCAQIGNMDDCVKACQQCADSCRKMIGSATQRPAGAQAGHGASARM